MIANPSRAFLVPVPLLSHNVRGLLDLDRLREVIRFSQQILLCLDPVQLPRPKPRPAVRLISDGEFTVGVREEAPVFPAERLVNDHIVDERCYSIESWYPEGQQIGVAIHRSHPSSQGGWSLQLSKELQVKREQMSIYLVRGLSERGEHYFVALSDRFFNEQLQWKDEKAKRWVLGSLKAGLAIAKPEAKPAKTVAQRAPNPALRRMLAERHRRQTAGAKPKRSDPPPDSPLTPSSGGAAKAIRTHRDRSEDK